MPKNVFFLLLFLDFHIFSRAIRGRAKLVLFTLAYPEGKIKILNISSFENNQISRAMPLGSDVIAEGKTYPDFSAKDSGKILL
jgi:hypothetical protein